jgi:hypothetical protein
MGVVLCAYCVVQKGERRGEGGRGWPGKVPRSPAAPPKEKRLQQMLLPQSGRGYLFLIYNSNNTVNPNQICKQRYLNFY